MLGTGSWGTALAVHLARGGHDVLLWGRDPEVCAAIEATATIPGASRYRDSGGCPVESDLERAFSHSETAVVAVPCGRFARSSPERLGHAARGDFSRPRRGSSRRH